MPFNVFSSHPLILWWIKYFTLFPVLIQLHDGLTIHLQMGRNTVEVLLTNTPLSGRRRVYELDFGFVFKLP